MQAINDLGQSRRCFTSRPGTLRVHKRPNGRYMRDTSPCDRGRCKSRVVSSPVPTVAIGDIKGRHAPGPAVKPETARSTAANAPNVRGAKATGETTMFPRMIKMIVRIVTTRIVTHPLAVVMNVRRFGVALAIGSPVVLGRSLRMGIASGCGAGPCGGTKPPPT